jgi:hypothetical protein
LCQLAEICPRFAISLYHSGGSAANVGASQAWRIFDLKPKEFRDFQVAVMRLPLERQKAQLRALHTEIEDNVVRRIQERVASRRGHPGWEIAVFAKAGIAIILVLCMIFLIVCSPNPSIVRGVPVLGALWQMYANVSLPLLPGAGAGTFFLNGFITASFVLIFSKMVLSKIAPDRRQAAEHKYTKEHYSKNKYAFILNVLCREALNVTLIGVVVGGLDVGGGNVVAQWLLMHGYHYSSALIVTQTVFSLLQMPFGLILYLVRQVFLIGFSSPEEKQLVWLEFRLVLVERKINHKKWATVLDAIIIAFWGGSIGVAIYLYCSVLFSLLGGTYAQQALTATQIVTLDWELFTANLGSNFLAASMSSDLVWLARMGWPGRSLPAWSASRIQALGSMYFGIPGAFSSQLGNVAVLLWGYGQSPILAKALGNTFKLVGESLLGLGTTLFQAWKSRHHK